MNGKIVLKKGWRPLKSEDSMTITLRNGEMRYVINNVDLVNFIKIDMANKKEIYLLINIRNCKSKTHIIYILRNFLLKKFFLFICVFLNIIWEL